MMWIKRMLTSSIGAKTLMAITGLALFGFLVGHASGNLLVFAGRDAFNTYAYNMQNLGPLLWVARVGLLALFCLHIFLAVSLTGANRAARPVPYASKNTVQANLASRTMIISGLVILLFVLYHLSHFTLRWIGSDYGHLTDEQGRHDAYAMVVEGFKQPVNVLLYVLSMLALAAHLHHGLRSLRQSLGINHKNINLLLRCGVPALGWLIIVAFLSIPVAVSAGLVSP